MNSHQSPNSPQSTNSFATRAIVIEDGGRAALREFATRPLESGEVRVQNTVSGISVGTEYLVVSGQFHGCEFPALLGYQGVGRIVEVAPDVANYSVGERVCAGLSRFQPEGLGQGSGNGHQSQPIVSQEGDFAQQELVRIPDDVADEEAVYAWLGAVAMQGVERAKVAPGDVVAVVGLGVVGQLAAQICRARGARVWACDLVPERAHLAQKLSADVAVAGDVAALNEALRHDVPEGASVVIECSGNTKVLDAALDLTAPEGRFVLQGHYPGEVRFRFIPAHWNRLTFVLPCAWGDLRPVLELMRQKKLAVAPFLAGTWAPEECAEVYARLLARDASLQAGLFRWSE